MEGASRGLLELKGEGQDLPHLRAWPAASLAKEAGELAFPVAAEDPLEAGHLLKHRPEDPLPVKKGGLHLDLQEASQNPFPSGSMPAHGLKGRSGRLAER